MQIKAHDGLFRSGRSALHSANLRDAQRRSRCEQQRVPLSVAGENMTRGSIGKPIPQ
jgi:hypothetical protein